VQRDANGHTAPKIPATRQQPAIVLYHHLSQCSLLCSCFGEDDVLSIFD
jgi:hypothetical protein